MDFSAFALFTAGLAAFVPLVSATGDWTQPQGAEPSGNPISLPGLNSVVPAGQPYTITWQPTTDGTVTLVLLKGPSTNAVPQYAIAQKIDNSGSYVWTPSTDLAPQDTGYGIELIVDATGQYQYTTQFGISNANYQAGAASSSWSSVWGAASHDWSTEWSHATSVLSDAYGSATSAWASATATSTSSIVSNTTTIPTIVPTFPVVASTGGMPANSSIVRPTGSMTVPSSLLTSATKSAGVATSGAASATASAPANTNGAASVAGSFAGLAVAAGVAVLAL